MKNQLIAKLREMGHEVVAGKGGFFIKNIGFVSTAKAQKMTGIKPVKRETRPAMLPYGDYATIVMINRKRA
jgi:hypothetical protein